MTDMQAIRETLKFIEGKPEPEARLRPEDLKIADLPAGITAEQKTAFGQSLIAAGYPRETVEAKLGVIPQTGYPLHARNGQR